jgi:hypothetical protein
VGIAGAALVAIAVVANGKTADDKKQTVVVADAAAANASLDY